MALAVDWACAFHWSDQPYIFLLSYTQTDVTTPKIVGLTMLGVIASVLAVVCKRMQQRS